MSVVCRPYLVLDHYLGTRTYLSSKDIHREAANLPLAFRKFDLQAEGIVQQAQILRQPRREILRFVQPDLPGVKAGELAELTLLHLRPPFCGVLEALLPGPVPCAPTPP